MSGGNKIMEGLKQALAVARGDADEIARCRVTQARTAMNKPDIPGELLEQWLTELGLELNKHGYAFAYSEGGKDALAGVLIKYDAWRKTAPVGQQPPTSNHAAGRCTGSTD